MNKAHWSTVYPDGGVPRGVLAKILRAPHKVPISSLGKKARREILGL